MRTNRVSPSLLLLWAAACAAMLVAWTPVAMAAACPSICKQTTIWGTGPASTNFAPCRCTTIVNGRGSGSNSCVCGVCYILVAGRVTGYDPESSGECASGATNCGDCDSDSGSGSGSTKNPTTTTAPPSTQSPASNSPSPSLTSSSSPSTPASGASSSAGGNTDSALPAVTPTPTPTPSPSPSPSPSPTPTRGAPVNGSTDVGSSSSSHGSVDHADGNAGTSPANASSTTAPSATTANSSSNDGLATWQIALIICSCVLVMAVVMMTITSCYCKARNRMKDNLQNEEERHEYEGYWNPNASGGITERSGGNEPLAQSAFNPAMTLGGRSSFNSTHSRPNSTKNVPYSEPTYAVTVDDRIGSGMARPPARQSLGSSNDLPGVFQPFPQRDPRPSHEVGSRKNIAIEL